MTHTQTQTDGVKWEKTGQCCVHEGVDVTRFKLTILILEVLMMMQKQEKLTSSSATVCSLVKLQYDEWSKIKVQVIGISPGTIC